MTGGQRRTILCYCGFKFVGHPTEVNKKIKRHQLRYCSDRVEGEKIEILPNFCKSNADANGWGGVNVGKDGVARRTNKVVSVAVDDEDFRTNVTLKHSEHIEMLNKHIEKEEAVPTEKTVIISVDETTTPEEMLKQTKDIMEMLGMKLKKNEIIKLVRKGDIVSVEVGIPSI